MLPVYKRLSFLQRHPAMTLQEFQAYYLNRHGPLAAAQPGFRRYAYGYVQNHVLQPQSGRMAAFDGLTCTYQVPREDYTRGFFNTEDYRLVVRPDEERVFDLAATRSVLAMEMAARGSREARVKYLLLCDLPDADIAACLQACAALPGFAGVAFNRLLTQTASGLGGGNAGGFSYDGMLELWLEQEIEKPAGLAATLLPPGDAGALLLQVRQYVIYMQDRPAGMLHEA